MYQNLTPLYSPVNVSHFSPPEGPESGPSAAVPKGPLGSITKSVNKIIEKTAADDEKALINKRLSRWAMQSAAGELLKEERVAKCLSRVAEFKHPNGSNMQNVFELDYFRKIQITHSPSKDSYYYSNLMACGSVWHCPICAAKISEQRRAQLVEAVTKWQKNGSFVMMLTLTVPHYQSTKLKTSLDGLSDALKRMTNSMAWKALSKRLGGALDRRIRALEVTYGQNGWHPHFHLLLFFGYRPPYLSEIESEILTMWKRSCKRAGMATPNSHGVSLQDGNQASEYVAKWGVEHEMTKGHIKHANKGYSPFDLLRNFLDLTTGDFSLSVPLSAALFKEYAQCFKGRRQLSWAPSLKASLLESSTIDQSDEDLVKVQEEDAELFASIPLDLWRIILRKRARGQVLEKCRQGAQVFWLFLESLEIHFIEPDSRGSDHGDSKWQSYQAAKVFSAS